MLGRWFVVSGDALTSLCVCHADLCRDGRERAQSVWPRRGHSALRWGLIVEGGWGKGWTIKQGEGYALGEGVDRYWRLAFDLPSILFSCDVRGCGGDVVTRVTAHFSLAFLCVLGFDGTTPTSTQRTRAHTSAHRALLSRAPSLAGGSSGSTNQVLEALRLHPQLTSKIQATIHRTDTTDAQKVDSRRGCPVFGLQSRPCFLLAG